MSKPLGVKSVTNPIVTSGAEDSENLENARQNAPLTVLTMERIVSLMDFENFARAFAGIGKAMGIWIWDGEKRRVHLTVASSTGPNHQIEPNSELYQNLVKAIDKAKDPVTYFQLDSFSQLSFNLEAKILVSKDREPERVLVAVKNALNEKFSFESRQFGQPVSLSEVKVIIQHVEGVLAVDVDFLYLSEEEPKLNKLIPSHIARYHNGTILLSELLVLNPAGVTLITEAANT
jgi:predicted phage baseplate assembly protein